MSDDLASADELVRLHLGDDDVLISENYEIKQSILAQPSGFTLRIGSGANVAALAKKYPPRTPFVLSVGGVVQQTGMTDGFELDGATGATEMTIRGRDALAPLHDAYIDSDQSIANATFADVVNKALGQSGISGYTLLTSNEANRKAIAGVQVKQTGTPTQASGEVLGNVTVEQADGPVNKAVQIKVGEKQYQHVKRILDRAGLFLWSTASGDFVLSAPNAKQAPTYRLVRQRGNTRNVVNVISARYKNDTAGRFSEAIVYGRGGGRKFGRHTTKGDFVDAEMAALGFVRPFVVRDMNVTNATQAELYARRRLAETRRAGWQLSYTLRGHRIPSTLGGQMAILATDTLVDVDDDEFDLKDQYYLEGLEFHRNPQTTTTITLMRREDLIFGTGEE